MSDNVALNPDTPRVDALIDKIMTQHPGYGKSAQAAYYEAVHQELAPLARQLERELVAMREERDSQQRVCIKVMEERDDWKRRECNLRGEYDRLRAEVKDGRSALRSMELAQREQEEFARQQSIDHQTLVERLRAEVEQRDETIAAMHDSLNGEANARIEAETEVDRLRADAEAAIKAAWYDGFIAGTFNTTKSVDAEWVDSATYSNSSAAIDAARAGEKGTT